MSDDTERVRSRLQAAYGRTTDPGQPASEPSDSADAGGLPPVEIAIQENADLVRRLARRYARATGGALDVDDLISVGIMGLIQAHQNYRPEGGKPFRTYAEFRIRGSILDELRKLDPMSQPMRRKVRKFEAAMAELAHELGRQPNERELAEYLEVSLDKLQSMRRDLQQVRFVAAESGQIDDLRGFITASGVSREQLRLVLTDALGKLPEREQQVIGMYYFHDLKLREIGEVLEVTEARVCQIHKAAVAKLRVVLEDADKV